MRSKRSCVKRDFVAACILARRSPLPVRPGAPRLAARAPWRAAARCLRILAGSKEAAARFPDDRFGTYLAMSCAPACYLFALDPAGGSYSKSSLTVTNL